MKESERPRSPFAGKLDFWPRVPHRVLSPDDIRQILAAHRIYVETKRRQGSRADFSSADLSGIDFSGLNLRRAQMDHSLLPGADFNPGNLQPANLIGPGLLEARLA